MWCGSRRGTVTTYFVLVAILLSLFYVEDDAEARRRRRRRVRGRQPSRNRVVRNRNFNNHENFGNPAIEDILRRNAILAGADLSFNPVFNAGLGGSISALQLPNGGFSQQLGRDQFRNVVLVPQGTFNPQGGLAVSPQAALQSADPFQQVGGQVLFFTKSGQTPDAQTVQELRAFTNPGDGSVVSLRRR